MQTAKKPDSQQFFLKLGVYLNVFTHNTFWELKELPFHSVFQPQQCYRSSSNRQFLNQGRLAATVTAPAGGSWWKFWFILCWAFCQDISHIGSVYFLWHFWEPPSVPANSPTNLFQVQTGAISAYPNLCTELLSLPFPQLYPVEVNAVTQPCALTHTEGTCTFYTLKAGQG